MSFEPMSEEDEQEMILDYQRVNRPSEIFREWADGEYESVEALVADINARGLWSPVTVAEIEADVVARYGTSVNPRYAS